MIGEAIKKVGPHAQTKKIAINHGGALPKPEGSSRPNRKMGSNIIVKNASPCKRTKACSIVQAGDERKRKRKKLAKAIAKKERLIK